jgi:hypothetical protein
LELEARIWARRAPASHSAQSASVVGADEMHVPAPEQVC